jgi:hypothetical protein
MAALLEKNGEVLLGDLPYYPPGLLGSTGTGRGRASAAPLSRESWARDVPSGALGVEATGLGARAGEGPLASGTSKVVVNHFYVAIEVPGFTRRDLTP